MQKFLARKSVLGSLGLADAPDGGTQSIQSGTDVQASSSTASCSSTAAVRADSVGLNATNSSDHMVDSSNLPLCKKCRLPLAAFGYMVIFASMMSQPVVWISIYGANPSMIGAINIAMTAYDILNTPFFGRWSDQGRFNILCFKDATAWGRRAPMALFSLPICALGFWVNWVGPESLEEQFALGAWFLMVRFLTTTALGGMFWTANAAAFTELFPNQQERVNMAMGKGVSAGMGVIIGAGVLSSVAIGVKEPAGSSTQRIVFMGIAVVSMLCIVLMIPWCLLMSKSVMSDTTEKESMWQATKAVWKSGNAIRVLGLALHFESAHSSIVIPLLPFFMRQCFGFSVEQAALAQGLTVLTFSLMYVMGFPLAGCLKHYFHPVKVIFWSCLVNDICYVACVVVARQMKDQVGIATLLLVVGMGFKGVSAAAVTLGRQILTGWIIDEDQVVRSRNHNIKTGATAATAHVEVRRDGIFTGFTLTALATGALWAGVCQLLLGFAGYEAERDKDEIPQPKAVQDLIFILCAVVTPVFSLLFYSTLLSFFPIVGERLRRVEKDYASLFTLNTIRKSIDCSDEEIAKAAARMSRRLSVSEAEEKKDAEVQEEKKVARRASLSDASGGGGFARRLSVGGIGRSSQVTPIVPTSTPVEQVMLPGTTND